MEDILTAKREALLNRIGKLLAFDATNTTEEEAVVATAKAQELLQRYNLDMSEVRKNGPKVTLIVRNIQMPTARLWTKHLLGVLAGYNFCSFVFWPGTTKGAIIGDTVNVDAVVTMFNHLVEASTLMCATVYNRYVDVCRERGGYPMHRSGFNADFYQGICDAIQYRLDKQEKEFAAKSNQCRALVITNKEELNDFKKETYGKVKERSTRHKTDSAIYQSGLAAGAQIELNKLVTEGK